MCETKFVRTYTKFFGGKMWLNLHRVSPEKFLTKTLKMASLKFFRPKLCEEHFVQNFSRNHF